MILLYFVYSENFNVNRNTPENILGFNSQLILGFKQTFTVKIYQTRWPFYFEMADTVLWMVQSLAKDNVLNLSLT